MNKKLLVLIGVAVVMLALVGYFEFSAAGRAMLGGTSRAHWLLPFVVVAALVDSINPCAFSVLLLTIAFLMGTGRLRRDIYRIAGTYIFGIFLVYTLIGLGILQALTLFGVPHILARFGAGLLVLGGLINIAGQFWPKFPIKLAMPEMSHTRIAQQIEKASFPAAFFLGCLVALFEFPCTGGPYLTVLGLLHDDATQWVGFGYLIFYNLIFVSPLVVILGIASDEAVLARFQAWRKSSTFFSRYGMGLAMVALGVIILMF